MEKEVKNKIIEMADHKYKEFNSRLCPNTQNIVGVRVPKLRNYAKQLAKEDWKYYLDNIEDEYYEEIMLQGMIIGIANMSLEERLKYLEKFIPKIDNWAVCDVTCAGLKFTQKNLERMWDFLETYLDSQKEFKIRFAVVMLLDYYINEEYIEKVLKIINTIKYDEYYVQMAIAWLISVAYVKFPNQTMKLLKKNNLDDFTYNKAIQKIIESYRIEEAEKIKIRQMKRA